jgi:dTDP-D-glucose 4,6-dehydratase
MSLLVTGGAGFIGSNFVLDWIAQSNEPVINLDKLTYAGNIENLQSLNGDRRHVFVQGDIGDSALVNGLLAKHQPCAIVNFAAESHVDRSIHGPEDFIQTNIVGKHKGMLRFYRKFFCHQYPGVLMGLVVAGVWLRFGCRIDVSRIILPTIPRTVDNLRRYEIQNLSPQ